MKTRLYKNPPPYLIVLASSVKTKEVEVIEFHRMAYVKPISSVCKPIYVRIRLQLGEEIFTVSNKSFMMLNPFISGIDFKRQKEF